VLEGGDDMAKAERRPPPAGRRGTLNEARWREVLGAARDVFEEKGYPSASLQDVASRVGMLKGSLYYYIDSKEDLLFDVLEVAHHVGLGLIEESEEEQGFDAVNRLAAFIQRWMGTVADQPGHIYVAEADLRVLGAARREPIMLMRRRINGYVQALIRTGIEEGLFEPTVDVRMAARSLFQLLNQRGSYRDSGPPIPELTAWYTRMFIRGLCTTESLFALAEPTAERSW
jgi:AcrR family transcriptional regulator